MRQLKNGRNFLIMMATRGTKDLPWLENSDRGDVDDTYGVCDVLALGVSDADVIDLFMLPLGLPTLLLLSFNTDDSFVL